MWYQLKSGDGHSIKYLPHPMRPSIMLLRRPTAAWLLYLLCTALVSCEADKSDVRSINPITSSAPTAPESVSKSVVEIRDALPKPLTPAPLPAPILAKVRIDIYRATDSVDLDALKLGKEIAVPPLQLSADIVQAPLRAVLKELAYKLDAKVLIADDVSDRLISLQLNGVDVAEGIKQMLRDTNYVLIAKEPTTSIKPTNGKSMALTSEIAEIHVLPNHSTGEIPSVTTALKVLESANPAANIEEWRQQAINAQNPADRMIALKQFLEHADSSEHNALLLAALEDNVPEVRKLAINSMADSKTPLMEPISQAALGDEDPQIRTTALDVLVNRYGEEATPILEQALSDPDSNVQQTAKNNLEMVQRVKSQMNTVLHRRSK